MIVAMTIFLLGLDKKNNESLTSAILHAAFRYFIERILVN